jgi:hypothetical protein
MLTAEYYRDRHFGGLVNFVPTTGTTAVAFNGGTGSPANQYETFELDYRPWFNVRFHSEVQRLPSRQQQPKPVLSQ